MSDELEETDIKTLTDPFILHTFLEENIDPEIGNDMYTAIKKFIRYLPKSYTKLLDDSVYSIDKINEANEYPKEWGGQGK